MNRQVRFDWPYSSSFSSSSLQGFTLTDNKDKKIQTPDTTNRESSARPRKRDQPWKQPTIASSEKFLDDNEYDHPKADRINHILKTAPAASRQGQDQRTFHFSSSSKTQTKTIHRTVNRDNNNYNNSFDPFEPFTESDIPWRSHNPLSLRKPETDDSLSPTSVVSLDSETNSSIIWAISSSMAPRFTTPAALSSLKALPESPPSDVPFDEQNHSLTIHSTIHPYHGKISSHHSTAKTASNVRTPSDTKALLQESQGSYPSSSTCTNRIKSCHPHPSLITERLNTIISQANLEKTKVITPLADSKQQHLKPQNLLLSYTQSWSEQKNKEVRFDQLVMSTLKDLNILSKSTEQPLAPTPVSSSVSSSSTSTTLSSEISRNKQYDTELQSKHKTKSILSTSTSKAKRIRPRGHVRFNDKVHFCTLSSMEDEEEEEKQQQEENVEGKNPLFRTKYSSFNQPQEKNVRTVSTTKLVQPNHQVEQNKFSRHPPTSGPILSLEEEFCRAVAAIIIQAFVRRHAANKLAMKKYKAIYMIQCFYRNHFQTKHHLLYHHRYHGDEDDYIIIAATRIQALVRGWLARECLLICGYCASVIQRAFQHYKRRCAFKYAMKRLRSMKTKIQEQQKILPDTIMKAEEESIEIRLLIAKWKKCLTGKNV